jgi:membrane-associated protein
VPLALLDSALHVIGDSSWTYAIVFAIAALDAFFPVVPSETALITAGVASAAGDLSVWLVILCAATGAVLGDNVSYWLGRTFGERVVNRYFSGERRKHFESAERALRERGGYFIVVGRFIPGGRIAVTFAAGTVVMPWLRFIRWDVLAATLWAIYGGLLGYFGGRTFERQEWKGLLLAFAVAAGVAGAVEAVRWYRKRRRVVPER